MALETIQRAVLENMNKAVYAVDLDNTLIYANPAFERLTGWSLDEALGKKCYEFFGNGQEPLCRGRCPVGKAISEKVDGTHHESKLTTRSGEVKEIHVSLSLLRDSRETFGAVGIMEDVTKAKEAERTCAETLVSVEREIEQCKHAEEALTHTLEKLSRSNRELEQFTSTASHDLQEPLFSILGFSDLLKAKFGEELSEKGREYIDRIQSAATNMQTMINSLLELSRVTTVKRSFAKVNLTEVVREVMADLEGNINNVGVKVKLGKLETIDADPVQMRQLLQNLISNAVKYRRDDVDPVIKISGKRIVDRRRRLDRKSQKNWMYQIIVEDNGIGFDEQHLHLIFNAFERLHSRRDFEGAGIGLTICHKIAVRHGGGITAKGRPGQGATFIVTLPVKQYRGRNRATAPERSMHPTA